MGRFARGYEVGFELGFMEAVSECKSVGHSISDRTSRHFSKLQQKIAGFPKEVPLINSYDCSLIF